ncbi:LysM domain-containing protein [Colletotrichum truncatum]|uniref:LysM domain-containing protein n=1 Tax=Colletotrichum truncatum TaxID=5467 RepID=A0ACC3ZH95_COLTU|nr:LysM domain-containing protein [Colletotrichum truncatum]KAF6781000.1 LysM domain-containing protein [Colletotrichum truncatum]
MLSFSNCLVVGYVAIQSILFAGGVSARDTTPMMPHDPSTTSHCSWWWDNDGSITCFDILEFWAIDIATMTRWNPSITPECGNFQLGRSYCVEAVNEPAPGDSSPIPSGTSTVRSISTSSSGFTSTSSSPPSSTSQVMTARTTTSLFTSSTAPTTTTTGNGIQTPGPIQPGMVANCNKFYFVQPGENCEQIASKSGLSVAQFISWNPSVGSTCGSLWANVNVCIGVVGFQPSPTKPTNGIPTPQPTQPGMTDNCYKFYFVRPGETCNDVVAKHGISMGQFSNWNPTVGSTCGDLWANVNVCVAAFQSIPSYQAYGCFTEIPSRALSSAGLTGQAAMTVEFCSVYCMIEKGRSFFGVQFGGECWCGDALGVGSLKAADGECNMPCTGNKAQKCGGDGRLNLYGRPNNPPVAYKDYGCYTEGTNTRAFGVANIMSDSMSVGYCADYCLRQKGTVHFGVEFGRECWCGNNLGIGAVAAPSVECNMACAGNSREKCGAANRINVYSTLATTPPMNFRYQGCFTELSNERALSGANLIGDPSMTIEKCAKFCIDKNFKLFGVQFGNECFCGSQRASGSTAANPDDCNMNCPGNPGQKCGGRSRLNIYQWN